MDLKENFLEGCTDLEKGAYLGAIASIATADRQASEAEMNYLQQLCDAADLPEQQRQMVDRAATETSGETLTQCLDILKNSELKFSLITDLMAFARVDSNYNEEEEESISKIAEYLGVNLHQFSLLNQFTEKAAQAEALPQPAAQPSLLSKLGMSHELENAGIKGSTLLKSLVAVAAPMILSRMMTGGSNRRSFGGGLSSVIGMLSGGRRFGTTGGLLGRILGKGGY